MSKIHYKKTKYGFEYGSAKITPFNHDQEKGWVMISVETPKCKNMQIYVTKTGKVRIFSGGEWKRAIK